MSLVDQDLLARQSSHSNSKRSMDSENVNDLEERTSYRAAAPESPGPVLTNEGSYDDTMLDEYYDEMMGEAPKKSKDMPSAPALPERSALRASRLLDGLTLKLNPEPTSALGQATPHDMYLSSEEDASSSADDFSDDELYSDSEESQQSSPTRRSHEDTARIVSVVFAGKPSIIELTFGRRSNNSRNMLREQQPRRRSIVSSSEGSDSRRLSISSTSTTSFVTPGTASSTAAHPPRSSSIVTGVLHRQRPSFLSIDPFASKSYHERAEEDLRGDVDTPKTPKTPAAVWKRTLSLVKKRSRPSLHGGDSVASRDTLSSPSVQTLPIEAPAAEQEESETQSQTQTQTQTPANPPAEPSVPLTYNEILRGAKKNAKVTSTTTASIPPPPPTPVSPVAPRTRILSGLALNRRKSIKV